MCRYFFSFYVKIVILPFEPLLKEQYFWGIKDCSYTLDAPASNTSSKKKYSMKEDHEYLKTIC